MRTKAKSQGWWRGGVLLETLASKLPPDAVLFSSKLSKIEETSGNGRSNTILQLQDGTRLSAEVVIACDASSPGPRITDPSILRQQAKELVRDYWLRTWCLLCDGGFDSFDRKASRNVKSKDISVEMHSKHMEVKDERVFPLTVMANRAGALLQSREYTDMFC
ncbi:hypothetical protein HAX54_009499 [Datura stramonium]|uniref:Uncharacterized protein n=1 Tax=Datura stramonium TaxID=4076 RepID=A0ABS8TFS9_DATST|nr:hypothetical protein [Datura stramonium]